MFASMGTSVGRPRRAATLASSRGLSTTRGSNAEATRAPYHTIVGAQPCCGSVGARSADEADDSMARHTDFTRNFDAFSAEFGRQTAIGGGDAPDAKRIEDVLRS